VTQTYRFGAVEVRPAERQLYVGGQPAAVGARAFDLLLALIDHRDRVLTKNELLDLVWPGLVVEENNLQVQVSTLRKVLGNQSIATLPGRGYRFTLAPDDEAPACPVPGLRHNLPAQLNNFVGRETEMAHLAEALVNARLVTLTGLGGTGKSRLALQVASTITGEYGDGVWLAELGPVTDEQRVPQVVGFVLGVKEEPGRPMIEALARYVRDKRLLIVLDNCEHLVSACADLARRLLQAGPQIKILASSREALHVTGETRFPVSALAIETDAVRLFAERAAAVQPAFRLEAGNRPAVESICKRLDGIPLAIELAAARVGALPVERIALLLDDVFRVLTQGDRTAPTRQQTLRASIDWSYELLSVPERIVLRRLAIFQGGWTLEAAEDVVAGGEIPRDDVIDLLTQLVEQSLVEIDARGERYRLLETVRQYALELAKSSGEIEPLRGRHVDCFTGLAQKARREASGARQAIWFARLDAELENLLSALNWCDEIPDGANRGLALNTALRHYWIRGGHLALGLRSSAQALARFPATNRTVERSSALFDLGQLHSFSGQPAQAKPYLEESIAIARELGDRRRIAYALQPLGYACMGLGQTDEARKHLEEGVKLAREQGDLNEIAAALNALGQLHRSQGQLDKAEPIFQQVLTTASQASHDYVMLIALLNLAMVWIDRGAPTRARSVLLEILAEIEEGGAAATTQSVLEVMAGYAALVGDLEATARLYGAAEAMAEQTGLHRDPADEAFLARHVDEARRRLEAAVFESSERAGRLLPAESAVKEARAWLEER
jgi:non-specific serine/threonine protein kinase